jgi:hypothetical protein
MSSYDRKSAAAGQDDENPPPRSTKKSIESARKFLYDEDDEPVSTTTSGGRFGGGGNKNTLVGGGGGGRRNKSDSLDQHYMADKRGHSINPLLAACIATCQTCKNYGMKRTVVAFVVACAVIFTILILVEFTKGGDGGGGGPTSNMGRMAEIQDLIVAASITSVETLTNTETPQHHALHWIAAYDPAQLPTSDSGILQRYALAVLYYSSISSDAASDSSSIVDSTTGLAVPPGWDHYDNWMSTKGVCIWYGIECVGVEQVNYDSNAEITSLNLTDNKVSGTVPSELAALQGLIRLDLSKNELEGTLPRELSTLSLLHDLYLQENSLQGTILSHYGDFADLKQLHLDNNALDGAIPADLERINGLRALGLAGNQFTGKIPELEQLADLGEWRRISIQEEINQSFVIPKVAALSLYWMLTKYHVLYSFVFLFVTTTFLMRTLLLLCLFGVLGAEILYVDDNRLTGPLPMSLTSLTRLVDLRVSGNHLTGSIPPSIIQLTRLRKLLLLVPQRNMPFLGFGANGGSPSSHVCVVYSLLVFLVVGIDHCFFRLPLCSCVFPLSPRYGRRRDC